TIVEHALAKYADADIVVFVGCGERGNEMAELLEAFPRLVDPRSGRPVMERTVLVVNTSNMPVVAREASVYLGVTIAEYYRDMGHRVAVMVDSLSRWAEALRDIAARLQEMPGEEGYPTAMASRLGALYERAGRARPLGSPERTGAVTLVCAVSPPGGDFSEPVTQAALRVAGGLWALDAQLARARQFPAVDWATSYSLYADAVLPALGAAWPALRARVLGLLQRDAELREIASLIGNDELEDRDRLVLAVASLVREHVLGQNAFDPNDAYSPPDKTAALAELAIAALDRGAAALTAGADFDGLALPAVRRALAELRRAPPADHAARVAEARRLVEGLR
ncbi:MAG: V-type ATP synthase subunit A, partial [Deltaproteobacteria bacterium]